MMFPSSSHGCRPCLPHAGRVRTVDLAQSTDAGRGDWPKLAWNEHG